MTTHLTGNLGTIKLAVVLLDSTQRSQYDMMLEQATTLSSTWKLHVFLGLCHWLNLIQPRRLTAVSAACLHVLAKLYACMLCI